MKTISNRPDYWGDWLDTGKAANLTRNYLLYPEAREIVCKQGFQNKDRWEHIAVLTTSLKI
jgi:hypothetical protein